MRACLIQSNGEKKYLQDKNNLDAFFFIDEKGKEIVVALHYRNGKPLFIIDRRNASDVPILIEENSQATYLIDEKVKGKNDAQEELNTL